MLVSGKLLLASLEPIEFYQSISGINQIIKTFYEFDKKMLEIPSLLN